jgi:hypothetical protein
MRKFAILLILLTSGAILLFSCQTEPDINFNPPTNPVTGDFRCKINGTQWVANKAAIASRMAGVINITGLTTDKKLITITLTDSGLHRYILSDITGNAGALQDSTLADPLFSLVSNQGDYPTQCGGEVNITKLDMTNKKISGTFSFKVFREMDNLQRNLTEGSFTDLTIQTELPPASTTDTFHVKIAGTLFTPSSITGVATGAPLPMLAINGTTSTVSKTVGLMMPPTITPGSYTLDFFGTTYIGQYNPDLDPNHSQASMSGTLQILEHNTTTRRIRGNFNFHAEALLNPLLNTELTEGYFSVKY